MRVDYGHPASDIVEGMEGYSDEDDEQGDTTREEDGVEWGEGEGSRSHSTESKGVGERSSPRKKPRITLARGEACVACR